MKKTNKMSKKIALMLAALMVFNGSIALGAAASAEELEGNERQTVAEETVQENTQENTFVIPEAPVKPEVDSYKDNDKINEYNKQVDSYNEAALSYNQSVDESYEREVEETNKANEEIAQHNAAEEQRVIDETAAIEEQYAKDIEQYQKDYDAYKAIEAKILALGYSSVEQYNNTINKYYNEPAKAAAEKNASTEPVAVSATYTIQEAEVKSGRMIPVIIEHNFPEVGLSWTEEFEIDANDIITFNSINAAVETTSLGYGFYYHTDDSHQVGYWWESYSSIGTNAKYHETTWNSGDSHTISFKDGKNHANDIEDIVVSYNYAWNAQRTAKTYKAPAEPTKAETPVANLLESLQAPFKKAYLELLGHMDLFEVPVETTQFNVNDVTEDAETVETHATEETTTASTAAETENIVRTAAQSAGTTFSGAEAVEPAATDIEESAIPMAASAHAEEIGEVKTPMAANETGSWALINFLAAIVTGLMSLILVIRTLGRKEDEDEETTINRKRGMKLLSLIPAVAAVVLFILTEDMTLKMQMTDQWTMTMILIAAIEGLVAILAKTVKEEQEKEEETAKATVR